MASKRKQISLSPTITKCFRVTSPVKAPNTDREDVENEIKLLANDCQSEPGPTASDASPSTSDHCAALSASEYDEATDVVLNDLGCVIKPLMCCEEVSCVVSSLSAGQKYKLLTDR